MISNRNFPFSRRTLFRSRVFAVWRHSTVDPPADLADPVVELAASAKHVPKLETTAMEPQFTVHVAVAAAMERCPVASLSRARTLGSV